MPNPSTSRAATKKIEARSEGGGERPDDHDDRNGDVDLLAAEHVGQTPEGEGADEGAEMAAR